MQPTVAISSDFLDAFAKLPRKEQQKTSSFLTKLRNDPTAPGINYEKIESSADAKIYSVRIDDAYRGIVVREQDTGVYLLLWVDHHDEAYDWARRKRCAVNPKTGTLQVYDVKDASDDQRGGVRQAEQVTAAKPLFEDIADDSLLALGVPEEQLGAVRQITGERDFMAAKAYLPADAYENLSWLANGFPLDEVLDLVHSDADEKENKVPESLSESLTQSQTLKSFVVVEGEDELLQILSAPLEKWRVFLHPSQRKLVQRHYNGPARVIGGAGTGKTVVAMHRARALAEGSLFSDDNRVLFTTYSSNLAADIKSGLRKLCTPDEIKRIDVINLDAWVARFIKQSGYDYRIEYDESRLRDAWDEAIAESGVSLPYEARFYMDEWALVIVANEAMTLAEYEKVKRAGRGVRLNRKARTGVWKVVEAYRRIIRRKRIRDVDFAMYEARLMLEQAPDAYRYSHVVVDEGQDFSAVAYRLVRALVPEGRDDIFIVGDSHQRIYERKAVLSRCGINIRGRSSRLRINYRTTEEIRKSAEKVLEGLSFDDLDGEDIVDDATQSLVHGPAPEFKMLSNGNQELDFLQDWITSVTAGNPTLEKDVCIVLRTNSLVDEYEKNISSRGIETVRLLARQEDDRSKEGVRVATMHRVKGLEFDYIAIAGANEGMLPPSPALRRAKQEDNLEHLMRTERCLVYVAMTRAKRGVLITSSGPLSKVFQR